MSITYRSRTIQAGGWVPVPINVLKASKLSVQARLLFALLNTYAVTGKAFPSRLRLADDMGIKERAVAEYIKELKDNGLITTERRGMGRTNLYYIEDITPELLQAIGTKPDAEVDVSSKGSEDLEEFAVSDMKDMTDQDRQNNAYLDRQNNAYNIDIKDNKKKTKETSPNGEEAPPKSRKSQEDISIERIEQANKGEIAWDSLSHRDFTLYFIREHNERFQEKPIVFDRYSSVGIVRDAFIGRYNLQPSEVYQFVRKFLDAYKSMPDNWGGLTWRMLQNHALMKRIYERMINAKPEGSSDRFKPKKLGPEWLEDGPDTF